MDVAFGHPKNLHAKPFTFVQGFDFDSEFEELNLQSNGNGNFVLTGNSLVAEWKDLSPNGRHARQVLSGYRPTYTEANGLTFDGIDHFLQLPFDIKLSTYSLYVVLKATAWGDGFCGSIDARNDFMITNGAGNNISIQQGGVTSQTISVGFDRNRFNLLSIRRINRDLFSVQWNDRDGNVLGNTATAEQWFGLIGKVSTGSQWTGSIKAFCLSNNYKNDSKHRKIKDLLYNRYLIPEATYGSILGMGDSITAFTDGHLPLLGTALTRAYANYGISGSQLTWGASSVNNMRSRFEAQMLSRPFKDKILLVAGTNDIAVGGVSAANFATELTQLVDFMISKGQSPSDICLCSTPYQQSGANAATLVQYQTQISSIAATFSTYYADVYQAMLDYPGGGDLLMADSLHPNTTGKTLIKDTIVTALGGAWN